MKRFTIINDTYGNVNLVTYDTDERVEYVSNFYTDSLTLKKDIIRIYNGEDPCREWENNFVTNDNQDIFTFIFCPSRYMVDLEVVFDSDTDTPFDCLNVIDELLED